MRIAAIVLSAGKSERMGRPKALLPLRGSTFLQNLLKTIAQSDVQQTIVVLGHNAEFIRPVIDAGIAVDNPDYAVGMITSIQCGIRALAAVLPDQPDGALLFLVDHPVVRPATINTLIGRFQPEHIILPVHDGRRGHPVLFSQTVLNEILMLPTTVGANSVVWKDPGRIVEVEVDDPGVVIDVDTPEHYAQLMAQESALSE